MTRKSIATPVETKLQHDRLSRFASVLGWRRLKEWRHTIPPGELPESTDRVIIWYEAGRIEDIVLQINTRPGYAACVYAMRYRLCSGWHCFSATGTYEELEGEAARLGTFLARKWFTHAECRRAYRLTHPECAGITWKKIQAGGIPYDC